MFDFPGIIRRLNILNKLLSKIKNEFNFLIFRGSQARGGENEIAKLFERNSFLIANHSAGVGGARVAFPSRASAENS